MALIRTILAIPAALLGFLLAAPIFLAALPFWAIAMLTRAVHRVFEPRPVPWQEIIEFTPTIGWKPKPATDKLCSFSAGTFHVKTDAQGWPGQASLADSDVVVFGDSYAFGYGVNAATMFSEVDPRHRIKPIGSPGFNMVQEVLLMEQMESQLRGKLVVWFIYFGNDLFDNLLPNLCNYRMPFVRQTRSTGEWEIVTEHVSPESWPFNFEGDTRGADKFACVFGDASVSGRTYSACESLIREGKKICDRAAARLVVMTIPWPIQLDQTVWERQASRFGDVHAFDREMPDRQLAAICTRLDVPLVPSRQHLNVGDHIPNEGHWNERGHRKVAAILADLHRQHVLENDRVAWEAPALDFHGPSDSWRGERRERSISEAT